MFKRILSLIIIVCFFMTTLGSLPKAHADADLGLPAPGTMVNLSPAYEPVIIKGLTVHKDNPFLFDFIVDVGQDKISGEPLKKEGEKLIKYFLASLAIPDKDVWVNLSPYEKNKMIPNALGQTDMGRDLLEQDYILKQITASLIYPEKQLGKKFWDTVYAKAQKEYGTTQVPVNTFNKVWIMADRAEVFERNQTAFVVDSHLKVMLEEDYLAMSKHQLPTRGHAPEGAVSPSTQIVREIILPELEKEVNTGKNFANLRQIFNSIILSSWYKRNLKEALLNQVYANQSKVKGINLSNPMVKQQIYEQYLKAYKKGVFNYIKEDINSANGQAIPKKYFSGGINEALAADPAMTRDPAVLAQSMDGNPLVDFATLASWHNIHPLTPDNAMMSISLAEKFPAEIIRGFGLTVTKNLPEVIIKKYKDVFQYEVWRPQDIQKRLANVTNLSIAAARLKGYFSYYRGIQIGKIILVDQYGEAIKGSFSQETQTIHFLEMKDGSIVAVIPDVSKGTVKIEEVALPKEKVLESLGDLVRQIRQKSVIAGDPLFFSIFPTRALALPPSLINNNDIKLMIRLELQKEFGLAGNDLPSMTHRFKALNAWPVGDIVLKSLADRMVDWLEGQMRLLKAGAEAFPVIPPKFVRTRNDAEQVLREIISKEYPIREVYTPTNHSSSAVLGGAYRLFMQAFVHGEKSETRLTLAIGGWTVTATVLGNIPGILYSNHSDFFNPEQILKPLQSYGEWQKANAAMKTDDLDGLNITEDLAKAFDERMGDFTATGRPGAGKDTLMDAFIKKMNMFLPVGRKIETIVMGDYFRGIGRIIVGNPKPDDQKKYGEYVKLVDPEDIDVMKKGGMIKDETAFRIINEILKEPRIKNAKHVFFNGFSRNKAQWDAIKEGKILLRGKPLIFSFILDINLPLEGAYARAQQRREDAARHKEELRADDTPEGVKQRQKEFENQTKFMVEDMQKNNPGVFRRISSYYPDLSVEESKRKTNEEFISTLREFLDVPVEADAAMIGLNWPLNIKRILGIEKQKTVEEITKGVINNYFKEHRINYTLKKVTTLGNKSSRRRRGIVLVIDPKPSADHISRAIYWLTHISWGQANGLKVLLRDAYKENGVETSDAAMAGETAIEVVQNQGIMTTKTVQWILSHARDRWANELKLTFGARALLYRAVVKKDEDVITDLFKKYKDFVKGLTPSGEAIPIISMEDFDQMLKELRASLGYDYFNFYRTPLREDLLAASINEIWTKLSKGFPFDLRYQSRDKDAKIHAETTLKLLEIMKKDIGGISVKMTMTYYEDMHVDEYVISARLSVPRLVKSLVSLAIDSKETVMAQQWLIRQSKLISPWNSGIPENELLPQSWVQGGIDLNTFNGMQWKISKDGKGVEMNVDPVMIERIRREGIDSLSPVIFSITPVISIWSLVGIQE